MLNSHLGLPTWIKTGSVLLTGFVLRIKLPFVSKRAKNLNIYQIAIVARILFFDSYPTPVSAEAILIVVADGLLN